MFPVRQDSPKRGDERQWLVQNQVVVRLGDFDHGCVAVEQLVHVLARLGRHQIAELASQQGDAAMRIGQVIAHGLERNAR